ncbi:Gfo/Idh/MocA family protein [Aestuariivivens sediminis]|uniref:Gfo/Idh/MocA family protein n=1 Tax=Aestuariivivens sediminis TaxID=2913557 RepID=UPI001F57F0CB|nr:Gfo/Idh/MocA family oxidoreductase [Aestuariivivens sediminis]
MKNQLRPRTIRWGIIGLGNIANKFATDLITVPDAQLYAVASRSQDKANAFALQYKAIKAYGNYEDLTKDPNVDAVYIATPHTFHKANTITCLKQGRAVLCEKPLAMNLEEVEDMIACAQANNTLLMEGLWTYFLPHYQYVLSLLQDKRYGKLIKLEADFGFHCAFDEHSRLFNKSLGGGSLLDIGIYPIFAALSSLGIPNTIDAKASFYDNGADSSCHMVFNYGDNVKAYLKSSIKTDLPTEAIFYCEKANIKINRMFFRPTTLSIISNGKKEKKDFNESALGYHYEISHFNQLLRDGKTESNIMTFDFSRNLMMLLDKVRNRIDLNYS